MNIRFTLAPLFVLLLGGIVLAGCGSSEAPSSTAGGVQNQQEKINNGAVLDQNGEK